MKGKLRLMWRGVIALVMVFSLGVVMAAPVAAEPDISGLEVTVTPSAINAEAYYKVIFQVHNGLQTATDTISVRFPAGTTVPAALGTSPAGKIKLSTAATKAAVEAAPDQGPTDPSAVTVAGQTVQMWLPGWSIPAENWVMVEFGSGAPLQGNPTVSAGIINPSTEGTYRLYACTCEEPTEMYDDYFIYETVPIDVYLKYQIPPVECGYIEYILVDSFLTIGEALDFVDELYTSGTSAEFTLDGAVTPYNLYGTWSAGWTDGTTGIGDTLSFTDITFTETESFTVTYNKKDGNQVTSAPISVPNATDLNTGLTDVVDVVSVTGADAGAIAGYQNTFNLTGDVYNDTAGDYGDFGITTAGTFTDGTSIGEALTVTVTTNPTTNPETYKVTYTSDDASGAGAHLASLTVKTGGTYVWSPAAPTNVVDVTAFASEAPAWAWYDACPSTGGLIGARVLVDDGTYLETINIHTPGVMVESVNGAASTTIDATGLTPAGLPASMHAAAVMITAEGVTFGGTGKGFTVKNAGVGVDAGGTGAASTLWADDNEDGIADVSGVYIWPNGGAYSPASTDWCRVNVIDNIIYGSQARGICADVVTWTQSVAGVSVYIGENTVYDNLFDGFSGDGLTDGPVWLDPGYLDPIDAWWGYTAIVDNEFYQNGPSGMGTWEYGGAFTTDPGGWKDAGIEIGSTVETTKPTCHIVGNDIHDNVHAGIHLLEDAAVDNLIIEENEIYDNGIFGIATSIKSADLGNVTCAYNDIVGNTHWGIKNFVAADFPAKVNYWGALGGPSCGPAPIRHEEDQRSDALGNGDAVSSDVLYEPWLTEVNATVVTSGKRSYGSDAIVLEAGWNTLSVPCGLKGTGDTFADIVAMGGYMDDWVGGYWYDASVPQWKGMSGSTTFEPGKGFYIKMSAASRFPVLYYDGSLHLPAYGMEAGWNLIGSMFGIDRDGTTDDGDYGVAIVTDLQDGLKTVAAALDSIQTSGSLVVSPSLPGQVAEWATTVSDNTLEMLVGESYWVFMLADGTLAGFEVTPFYLP